ncbi:MAG: putative lipid II flippase FtsW [Acidimicrobiales bacterium]
MLLVVVVGVLNVIGLVMVLSASSVNAIRQHGSAWFFFERQLIYVAAGTVCLGVASQVDYRRWRRAAPFLMVATMGLLFLVLVPGLGVSVNGSARWLGAGPLQFQPSELAKLGLLVAVADLLTRRAGSMHEWRVTLLPALLLVGIVGGLVMLQPDLGTTSVALGIVLVILFIAGTPLRHLTALVTGGSALLLLLGVLAPYRRARLLSFLDPCRQLASRGYQQCEGLVAQGSGHLTGVGLGAGRAKWGFLPNAHTDFIFATIGEDLGLIGTVLVVALFLAFACLGVRAALRAPDRFGTLLAAGVTAWVVVQAFVNVGAVIDILPVTGVTLPFVSFGGTSLIITMGAVGILLNVAAQERPAPPARRG